MITYIMNQKQYQDIFNLGLLNYNNGASMLLQGQVSAPTGGSVNATLEIRYDPITCKFILVQDKFDAAG